MFGQYIWLNRVWNSIKLLSPPQKLDFPLEITVVCITVVLSPSAGCSVLLLISLISWSVMEHGGGPPKFGDHGVE